MKKWSRLTAFVLAFAIMLSNVSGALALVEVPYADLLEWIQKVKEYHGLSGVVKRVLGGEVIVDPTTFEPTTSGPQYMIGEPVNLSSYAGDAEIPVREVALDPYGKVSIIAPAAGQWQVCLNDADIWVNVTGETGSTFDLTFAKVESLFAENNAAQLRCVMGDSVTETVNVNITSSLAVMAMEEDSDLGLATTVQTYAAANDGIAVIDDDGTYIVEVAYQYADGTTVASSTTYQIAAGTDLNTTIEELPRIEGYLATEITVEPAVYENTAVFNAQTADNEGSVTLNISAISASIKYTVQYTPTYVTYTVKHYQQNLNDDDYALVEIEVIDENDTVRRKVTGDKVGSGLEKTYSGFTALWYNSNIEIAADGTTVVEIYYDRNYYLMTFDLDGGYGVEPVYARYGTPVSVGTPQRNGYTFVGWTNEKGDSANIPAKLMENCKFVAKWKEATTEYSVVYWLENPNDESYSYWGSYTATAQTGTVLNPSDYSNYNQIANDLDENEKRYSEYNQAKTEAQSTVTVAADGTSVVNVYYDRKEYTLKFYYAASSGTGTDAKYYVVGGSTYYFGYHKDAYKVGDRSDEVKLFAQYMNSDATAYGQRGEVEALPTLNANGLTRGYTSGTDQSVENGTTYTYHYIAFDAKYGADISELWPCDVFESVTRKEENTHEAWPGSEAFVSAWNGEHNVYYTQQHRKNQTIKGNYNQLDTQLLWDYDRFKDSDTVAYLCFWENGADIPWSVPELYRYNIMVPSLDNESEYVRRYQYDTVDDSSVDQQTPPAVTGFTYIVKEEIPFEEIKDFDKNLYREAYDVFFYYTRNEYELKFQNRGMVIGDKTEIVPFETNINGMYFVPEMPEGEEDGSLVFVGWYTSPGCFDGTEAALLNADGTTFTATLQNMPVNNVQLYAKWVPSVHTVTIFTTQYGDVQKVTHRQLATEPQNPENGNYTFLGWYYKNDAGEESRFDFATMPIVKDMDIYAKWGYSDPITYTFSYVYENENGEKVKLAPDTVDQAMHGQTVTLPAKVGEELTLAGDDKYGYFPNVSSHSLVMDAAKDNTFEFVYTKPESVGYTVQYLKADENWDLILEGGSPKKLAEDKTATTSSAIITEQYKVISGYMAKDFQIRLIVTSDAEQNVIQFLYKDDTENAYYTVTHYIQNLDGNYTKYLPTSVLQGKINQKTDAQNAMTIEGFTYDHVEIVKHYVEGSADVTEKSQATQVQAELTAGGMDYNFYYTRKRGSLKVTKTVKGEYANLNTDFTFQITFQNVENSVYTYKVYQTDGTELDGKTGTIGGTSNTITLQHGQYAQITGIPQGAQYTVQENSIEGFAVTSTGTTGTIAADVEAKADFVNVHQVGSLSITKTVDGNPDDYFVFQVKQGDKEIMKVYVKAGETKTIENLPAGDYTVTELDSAWRYKLASGETVTKNATVETGKTASVSFKNVPETDQWLDNEVLVDNKFN